MENDIYPLNKLKNILVNTKRMIKFVIAKKVEFRLVLQMKTK